METQENILRKERKRLVRVARRAGSTVPFDLRTLIEDGWSLDTIRAVYQHEDAWHEEA